MYLYEAYFILVSLSKYMDKFLFHCIFCLTFSRKSLRPNECHGGWPGVSSDKKCSVHGDKVPGGNLGRIAGS